MRIGDRGAKLKLSVPRSYPAGVVRYAGSAEEVGVAAWRTFRFVERLGVLRAAMVSLPLALLSPGVSAEPPAPGDAPAVGLGQLLHLPKSYQSAKPDEGPRGTADEWRARYAAADEGISEARAELQRLQGKLEAHAQEASSWNVAAPGLGMANPEDVPMNFTLSQQIRVQKEAVEQARRNRKMLDVEADLAGVPEDWRTDPSSALRAGAPDTRDR